MGSTKLTRYFYRINYLGLMKIRHMQRTELICMMVLWLFEQFRNK